MAEQSTNGADRLDYATSTSICRAIGEKLVHVEPVDDAGLPPRFQSLLAALQRQDDQLHANAGSGLPPGSAPVTG